MLTKVRIKTILGKYFLRVKKATRSIDQHLDHAALHEFRVSFKKLRSFLRLLSVQYQSHDAMELPARFKKMNKALGEVFDEQLCKKRLDATVNIAGYFPKQGHTRYRAVKRLLLPAKALDEIEVSLKAIIPAQLDGRSVRQFFMEKKKKARDIVMKRKWSDKALHSIRKLQKDMVNVSKLWRDLRLFSRSVFPPGRSLERAEGLSDKLGELNDCSTALKILSPAVIAHAPLKHRTALRHARRQWINDKRVMKERVIDELVKRFG